MRLSGLRLPVLFVTACLGMAGTLGAQISPGPLAKAHAQLEGALNCTRCHGPAARRHVGIVPLLPQGGRVAGGAKPADTTPAVKRGRRTVPPVIRIMQAPTSRSSPGRAGSEERFDHRAAGWALEGSHREVRCAECHTAEYRVSESATLLKRRTATGWTGLETTCASCHRSDDEHRGALNAKCDACHDSRDWKPAPRFSHDSTDYALTGKHAEVECNDVPPVEATSHPHRCAGPCDPRVQTSAVPRLRGLP